MSKSIYDEALEIMVNSILPRESNKTNKLKVIKALEQALKQEKLLKQYKKVADAIVRISIKYPLYVIRESEGKMVEQSFNRIKELENE